MKIWLGVVPSSIYDSVILKHFVSLTRQFIQIICPEDKCESSNTLTVL